MAVGKYNANDKDNCDRATLDWTWHDGSSDSKTECDSGWQYPLVVRSVPDIDKTSSYKTANQLITVYVFINTTCNTQPTAAQYSPHIKVVLQLTFLFQLTNDLCTSITKMVFIFF